MPNRILKESICYSENVDSLTLFQEVFFYRLIVNCDDYGRLDARTKVLSSKLFPLRDVKDNQIKDALAALVDAELVTVYESDGHIYLQMNTWDRHQNIRAKKSKYPQLDDTCKHLNADDIRCNHMNSDDIKCNQMNTNVPVIQSNPILSNTNPNTNPNPIRNPSSGGRKENALDELFDLFWDVYPRKESKLNARKAFDKIKPDRELFETMVQSIQKWKLSAQWQDSQFIPYPASWLNQRRWEDEIPAPSSQQKPQRILPAQDFQQRDYSGVEDDMMASLAREMAEAKARGEL